jgi:branched-chain amino acid transport system substrate-binding protein
MGASTRGGAGRRRMPALLALLALAAALLLTACGSSDSSSGSGSSDAGGIGSNDNSAASGSGTIKLGLLSTLEGPFAPFGEAANMGAKVALLEFGGKLDGTGPRDLVSGAKVGGKSIELSVESSDATPDVAVEATRRLVEQNKVDVMVGPLSGDEGIAVKNYAKNHLDVTFVNGSSGAQNTTLRDPAPNFFRYNTDGAQWMAGLGKYAAGKLGYKHVATVGEDYSFPYDQVGGFMTEYCAAGGHVDKKIWVPLGTKDYASFIAQIPKNLDAVYVALGGTDALNFTKQFDEFTGKKVPLLGGSITVDGSIIAGLKDRVEGTVSAGPVAVLDTPEYKAYADALKKNFPKAGPPGLFDLSYYLNMKSLLQGLDKSGGDVSGEDTKLRETLSSLSWTTPLGPLKLDENRQAISNNYLFKVTNGQSTLLSTVKDVNQTLGFDRQKYIASPSFDRENPSCK